MDDEQTKETVEAIALRKGLLPQFFPGKEGRVGADGRAKLATAPRGNPNHWKFAAARGHARWVEGSEVTEEEFDAAVDAAINTPIR